MIITYSDVEDVISALKHTPESVDLDRVRGLLRGVQEQLEVIYALRSPQRLSVELLQDDEFDFGRYRVELSCTVDDAETLLRLLYVDD